MNLRSATFLVTALSVISIAGPAFAGAGQTIDPDSLPPSQREYALHGKLYDRDPFGRPADPGCIWSRIQVPSGQGLKWLDEEDCQPSDGPP